MVGRTAHQAIDAYNQKWYSIVARDNTYVCMWIAKA